MAGRKTKLTKELIKEATDLIKAGNYITVVCNYLGISQETWYRWLREGEQEKSGLKCEFYERVRQAEAESEIRLVMRWQQQMPDSWKSVQEFLERRYPDRWSRKDRTEITGKDGGAIEVDISETRERIISRVNEYASRRRENEDDTGDE